MAWQIGMRYPTESPIADASGFNAHEGTNLEITLNLQQSLPRLDATESGIKLMARPIHMTEPDLLAGHERYPLVVTGPSGNVLARFQSAGDWTYEDLRSRLDQSDVVRLVDGDCADAYLGAQWIGGTEV